MQNRSQLPVDVPRPQEAGGLTLAVGQHKVAKSQGKVNKLSKLQFHSHHHAADISPFSHRAFKIMPTFLSYMFWSGPLTFLKTLNIWESLLSRCRLTVTTSLWCAGQDSTGYETGSSLDTFIRWKFKEYLANEKQNLIHKELFSSTTGVVQDTKRDQRKKTELWGKWSQHSFEVCPPILHWKFLT